MSKRDQQQLSLLDEAQTAPRMEGTPQLRKSGIRKPTSYQHFRSRQCLSYSAANPDFKAFLRKVCVNFKEVHLATAQLRTVPGDH